MIATKQLTKRYGPVTALDALDLEIGAGETFGLLGPNGAGKTTTLRLLAGLAEPTAGSVRVNGQDPWQESEAVRTAMGVLPDGAALYERLTVEENLRLYASLYRVPRAKVTEALEKTGVADLKGRLAKSLSKGQRQRVALARAILHEPKLLFLDEPTSGLDPTAAASFHELIQGFAHRGVTVVLSSHDMAEVDQLCHRVAILDRGRLMACDSPAALKARFGQRNLVATLATDHGPETVEWSLTDPDADVRAAEVVRSGRLLSLHTKEASLVEVFIRLTGRNF